MQGSNFSRIGMTNQRKGFVDDQIWGYGKKETRGSKGKGSKNHQLKDTRRNNSKRNYEDYNDFD